MTELQTRPYQTDDIAHFEKEGSGLILYEPRLGKTVVGCVLANRAQNIKRVLIVCPKNAMYVWKEHVEAWVSRPKEIRTFIADGRRQITPGERSVLWGRPPESGKVVFYITSYGSLIADTDRVSGIHFNMIICDEAKRIRNRSSKAFKLIAALSGGGFTKVYCLEGTPTKEGPMDFWTMLFLADRQRFRSYWKFVEQFHFMEHNGFAQVVGPPNPASLTAWREILKKYTRIRFRKDVRPDMPAVTRQIIPVDMDPDQAKVYMEFDNVSFHFAEDGQVITAPNTAVKLLRLRQLMSCPKIIDPSLGYGGALTALVSTLEDMPEKDRHIVIYAPFKETLIWAQELFTKKLGCTFEIMVGGIHPNEQQERIKRFKDTRGIMGCSVRYAEAFSLAPAQACYFIGFDYDPNVNKQAEDRLIPQEGVNPIYSGYYIYNGCSVDAHTRKIVERKHGAAEITMIRSD